MGARDTLPPPEICMSAIDFHRWNGFVEMGLLFVFSQRKNDLPGKVNLRDILLWDLRTQTHSVMITTMHVCVSVHVVNTITTRFFNASLKRYIILLICYKTA